jgi:hypothetical protein
MLEASWALVRGFESACCRPLGLSATDLQCDSAFRLNLVHPAQQLLFAVPARRGESVGPSLLQRASNGP